MNFKYLICLLVGHKWTLWEDKKFISGIERSCPRCKLHQDDDGDGTNQYSWMREGGWVPAKPWRKH